MVANRLDLQGPNFLVDAACTSAIVAIQQAIRSLELGETDLMLVGASQATMEIPIIQMFSMLGAISSTDIQPFNSLIDGTLLSEGVGFVVLKRLEDARRDSDRIYAVIRGLGLASDEMTHQFLHHLVVVKFKPCKIPTNSLKGLSRTMLVLLRPMPQV